MVKTAKSVSLIATLVACQQVLTAFSEGQLQQARDAKRQIGVVSATFLVVNRVIGTGIFATPGAILTLSGSVGLSLFMWVAGMLIAAAGTAVYLEFGTAIPQNGGEKNYLEYVFRKPKFLTTGLYTGYVLLLGWASGNSVIFGYVASVPLFHPRLFGHPSRLTTLFLQQRVHSPCSSS
jgi:amino acid transporter